MGVHSRSPVAPGEAAEERAYRNAGPAGGSCWASNQVSVVHNVGQSLGISLRWGRTTQTVWRSTYVWFGKSGQEGQ